MIHGPKRLDSHWFGLKIISPEFYVNKPYTELRTIGPIRFQAPGFLLLFENSIIYHRLQSAACADESVLCLAQNIGSICVWPRNLCITESVTDLEASPVNEANASRYLWDTQTSAIRSHGSLTQFSIIGMLNERYLFENCLGACGLVLEKSLKTPRSFKIEITFGSVMLYQQQLQSFCLFTISTCCEKKRITLLRS